MELSFEEQARKRKELAEKRVKERHQQLYKAESEKTKRVREEWKKLEAERKEKDAQQMKKEKELLDIRMAQLKRDSEREKEVLARNHSTASRMQNKKCAFGSSTPRELSYLNHLRKDQKIYDQPLSPEGSVSTEVSRRSGPPSRTAMSSIMSSSVYVTPTRSAPRPKTVNTENIAKAKPQTTNSARLAPRSPNLMTQSLHMGRKSINEVPQRPKPAPISTPKRDIKVSKPPRASPAPADKATPKKPARASLPPVPKPRVENTAKKVEKKEEIKNEEAKKEVTPELVAAPVTVEEVQETQEVQHIEEVRKEAVTESADTHEEEEAEQTVIEVAPEVMAEPAVPEDQHMPVEESQPTEEHAKFTIDSRSNSENSIKEEDESEPISESLPASTEAHIQEEAIKLIEEAIDTAVSISDSESHHEEYVKEEPLHETPEVKPEDVEIVIPAASPIENEAAEPQTREELISLASPVVTQATQNVNDIETAEVEIDVPQQPAVQHSEFLQDLLAPVAPEITVSEPKVLTLADELSAAFGSDEPLTNGSHHDSSFETKEVEVKNATNSQPEENTSDNEVKESAKEPEESKEELQKRLEEERKEKEARKARLAEIMTNVRAGGRISPPSEDGKVVPRALSANTLAILQRIKKDTDNGSVQVPEPTATAANN